MKKLRIIDTYLECGLRFFIFSQKGFKMAAEDIQNVKKMTKKIGKNSVHDLTRCACTQAHGLAQTILNRLGEQTLHMMKVWPSHAPLKKHDKT